MYMTLKELIDKLNKVPKHYHVEAEKQVIVDAWVAGKNDKDYPPGSILFECSDSTDDYTHILSVYPDRINKRLN